MSNNAINYVFIVALVAISLCSGQNNTEGQSGTTTDSDVANKESALQKGMTPIFDLYHSFLDTVMPKSFYSADTPFNVKALKEILQQDDYSKLQRDWKDLVATYGGYAACVIMGLIFVILMPVVGCIYCCCHCCCHKCGGTRENMDPKHASCKRWTYTTILLICATFMLAGAIITFLGSDLLHRSLKNEDDSGLAGNLQRSLTSLQLYLNNTANDVRTKGKTVVVDGVNKIIPEIEGAVDRTVNRIKDTINATSLLNQTRGLGSDSTQALKEIKALQQSLQSLKQLQVNVTGTLVSVGNDVKNACSVYNVCKGVDSEVQSLTLGADYTRLDNLENVADNLGKAANISELVTQAEQEFNSVSTEINNTVQQNIADARKTVNETKTTALDQIDELDGFAKPVVDKVKGWEKFPMETEDDLKQYADYIWYGCIGLACAVLLVVFFYYMGVVFGLCGERPGHRANCCNRETGANLLCAGICFTFLFAWILMLVTIVMFAVGGLGYTMACKYVINNVEGVSVFEEVISDGFNFSVATLLKIDGLTLSGMLKDCKDDKTLYTAMKLESKYKIQDKLNLTDTFNKLKQAANASNFNLPDITLLTPSLETELQAFQNSGIGAINFTNYTEELSKPLFGSVDLSSVIKKLRNASAAAGSPEAATLNNSASQLEYIRTVKLPEINSSRANLSKALENLQQIANRSLTEKVDSLIASINGSQNKFNSNKTHITEEELDRAVDSIIDIVDALMNDTIDMIKNDVGKCKPIYDAAQSTVNAVCVVTLDPLNCIWFGLGWSLFFYIPCFIFAALLASLYKRSDKYKKDRGFDDPIRDQYPGPYDNGNYGAGRLDDTVPLTSVNKEQRNSSNGAYNQGYQGRQYEQSARYHGDGEYPSQSRYSYIREREASHRGSYAHPHTDPYDQPPLYDEAMSPKYQDSYGPAGGDKAGY